MSAPKFNRRPNLICAATAEVQLRLGIATPLVAKAHVAADASHTENVNLSNNLNIV